MKSLLLTCLLTFTFSTFTVAQTDYTADQLQQIYIGLLSQQEIESWVDEDGDVQFEYDDKSYFIGIYEDDPEFFQLSLFNIWPIESTIEATQVLNALDVVNRDHKVVKGYTIDDNVWLAVELFISSPFESATIITRSIEALEEAVDTFVMAM